MRALVVYYSWTGNTAKAANAIASALGADIEEIRERRPRAGRLARLRCALDTALQRKPPVLSGQRNPADYDIVIVGSPVWARAMAGPVRSWLSQNKGRIKRFAAFCTEAGAGGETVIDVMGQAAGAPLDARLVVRQSEIEAGALGEIASAFATQIRKDPLTAANDAA